MTPGPRNLITDIAGLRVGNAEDATLKSGTTVLVGAAPFVASVAVMGGAPGTRETDLLEPDKMAPAVDALVLSGGSAFGLAAAQGVMDALAEQGRGFAVVADEVRALASRTATSTEQIHGLIENLQTAAKRAVDAMRAGHEQADQGVAEVIKADEALDGIRAAIERINEMTDQIASAAEEQSAVAEGAKPCGQV